MSVAAPAPRPWHHAYRDRRLLVVLAMGFASGLPILLIGGTLTVWLREGGLSRGSIGLFAYAFAPYTFKFAWAPLLDRLPLPPLTTRLGRRRGWLLGIQVLLVPAILALGRSDPAIDPFATALAALAVAFCSASQDIVIDAYRIESLPAPLQGHGAALTGVGYRVGMWVASGGTLLVADRLGWSLAYTAVAAIALLCVAITLLAREPVIPAAALPPAGGARSLGWLGQAIVVPFREFFARRGPTTALIVLAFVALFKASDVLLTFMAGAFYIDLGFTKTDIALVSGSFGIAATLLGGLLGGFVVQRLGLLRALMLAGVLQAASNLMFIGLAEVGPSVSFYALTVLVENLSGGLGAAALVAYLSSLCSIHYTAVQYALLSSFTQLLAKFAIVPASGFLADALGWRLFFAASALFALPGLGLLTWLHRRAGPAGNLPPSDPAGIAAGLPQTP